MNFISGRCAIWLEYRARILKYVLKCLTPRQSVKPRIEIYRLKKTIYLKSEKQDFVMNGLTTAVILGAIILISVLILLSSSLYEKPFTTTTSSTTSTTTTSITTTSSIMPTTITTITTTTTECQKYYECPDGTNVSWCVHENDKCVCIISPENQCPGAELVLDNVYSLGTPIEIKVKDKATSSIYYEASGCGPAYQGTYLVSSSAYGKINIAKPCGICPTLLRIEEIKPGETKTIDTWNQKQYDKECNCTTNSTCGEKYVNEGTYTITFYYNFQTSKLFSKVVSKDIKILKPTPS